MESVVNTSTEELIIGSRYRVLDKIGAGGMGTVYRAHDLLTQQIVALKRVTVSPNSLDFNTKHSGIGKESDFRLLMAQEFRTLASLRHPHIITVLDYGFDNQRQPYFTMELLENPQTILDASEGKSEQKQIELLIQMLQALVYLHRRGIIHRDLKPDNVLVVNGEVRVVDFGLAIETTVDTTNEGIAGTIAYLSPELLDGQAPSQASDMYAVGVIAYQIFSGIFPFDLSNLNMLVIDIMQKPPDMLMLDASSDVIYIVERLLAKDPDERFESANGVLQLLVQSSETPIQLETSEIRDSFLQAADFVGREAELQQLIDALEQARKGKGSAWLIAGESGVGKSRLLDEVRIQALVKGMLVLRGQSVAEGGAPFQIWREVLRRLSLYADLTDFEASVLKILVPDIGTLLGRDIPDAPEIEPQATKDRLLKVLEDVIVRQEQPLVLLLEDLQWAHESLDMMKRLITTVKENPLLLIANYRDDERPDLPDILPETNFIKLERLQHDSIEKLSTSMLGERIGKRKDLIDFLKRETEGNIFFIIEVVRTLADEAGNLDHIAEITLPENVFVGGMKTVLQRRLNRIPDRLIWLFQVAAIAGRALDLRILRYISVTFSEENPHSNEEIDIDHWLTIATNASVVEVQDEHWQFTHDKLRDGLLEDLTEETSNRIHGLVARAIEDVYTDDPSQYVFLAYHWAEAKNHIKETQYTALAGEQALANGVYDEAINFLTRALARAEEVQMSKTRQAVLEQKLGLAYYDTGYLMESTNHLERSLRLTGNTPPNSTVSLFLKLIGQVSRQFWHRIKMDKFSRTLGTNDETKQSQLIIAAEACDELAPIAFYQNKKVPTLYYALLGLNQAEQAGEVADAAKASFYINMAMATGIVPVHSLAEMYARHATTLLDKIEDPESIMWVHQVRGAYLAGRGHWEESEKELDTCINLAEEIGNSRRLREGASLLSYSLMYRGKWNRIEELITKLSKSAERNGDHQYEAVALNLKTMQALRFGKYMYHNTKPLEESISVFEKLNDYSYIMSSYGALNQIYLRRHDLEHAHQYAEKLLELMEQLSPTAFYMLEGYSRATEFYLTMYEQEQSEKTHKLLKQSLKHLNNYAKIFDIGRPINYVYQTWYHLIQGETEGALQPAKLAQETAQQLNMEYDLALLQYHQGRFMDQHNPKRREILAKAAYTFKQLGAEWDLTQTHELLG